MRQSSLLKLVEDPHPVLTLHPSSVFNLILYPDILSFIEIAFMRRETGIFNLVSSSSIGLAEIAKILGKDVTFGDYRYEVGNISNRKAVQFCSALNKSSEDVLQEFVAQRRLIKQPPV